MIDAPSSRSPVGIPIDWRERLLTILASEGVTEPRHRSIVARVLREVWTAFKPFIVFNLIWSAGFFIMLLVLIGLGKLLTGNTEGLLNNDLAFVAVFVIPFGLAIWYFVLRFRRIFSAVVNVRRLVSFAGSPNPSRALMHARRPPILYLRSFKFDADITSISRRHLLIGWLSAGGAGLGREQELVKLLSRYGSVLAIGRPGEGEPPPGALRFYVTDTKWQEKVESILPLCRLVVWASGETAGLRWEMDHFVKTAPPRKLLLWVHAHIGRAGRDRAAEWARFVDAYADVFPKPLPGDVESARFVAFEDDWTPRPIPGKGYRPALGEYFTRSYWRGLKRLLKERLG